MMARQIVALLHDMREAAVVDLDFLTNPALARKAEPDGGSIDLDMAVVERGDTEGLVFLGGCLVADAHACLIENADYRGQNFFTRHTGKREVLPRGFPDGLQSLDYPRNTIELRLVPDSAIRAVISILLASAEIVPDRLQVPRRAGANPHTLPCRRDRESANAFDLFRGRYMFAPAIEINEAFPAPAPGKSRGAVVNISEANNGGGAFRIEGQTTQRHPRATEHVAHRSGAVPNAQAALRVCLRAGFAWARAGGLLARLRRSASMISTTGAGFGCSCSVIFFPLRFCAMSCSTFFRYSS